MKVLQLGKFYPIRGGVEKVMWDLTRGLAERGVDCDMLCAILDEDRDVMARPGRLVSEIYELGTHGRCVCVPARRKVAATMISPNMVRWLRRHKSEYDIIHVHHPDPMACLALRLSGYKGKVVLHWHSDILKQKGLLKLYMPLQKWLVRRADRIVGTTPVYVAQSPYLQDVQDKVTYFPIGIEDNVRTEVRTPLLPCGHVVFTLGRLVEYKGFKYLVEAAKYLPDGYKVIIGGGGPLRPELQAQIEDNDLTARVKLAGFLSEDEVRKYFNGCSLFVLGSIMKTEAFGIVQIEAMSCAKPVVATHIPSSGVDWVNEDGVSGINVAPEDPKALADAIVAICSDEERYRRYCMDARRRFEDNFTLDRMIDNCLSVYDGLR